MDEDEDDWDDRDIPESGAVFAFGENVPEKFWIGGNKLVIQVSCGEEHTCILSNAGKVYTFGKNSWGQLGIGNTNPSDRPVLVKNLKREFVTFIACGRNHTLVYTESHKLFGFGNNTELQIGEGLSEISHEPKQNMRCSNKQIRSLSAGGDYSALITISGELFTWGSNDLGQLGIGEEITSVGIPQSVSLPGKVRNISCGHYHMGAVLDDGRLFMWGEAEGGKLGVETDEDLIEEELDESHSYKPVFKPLLVDALNHEFVIQVACGLSHSLALTQTNRVYAWGEGRSGQLGLSTHRLQVKKPILLTKHESSLLKVKTISAGESHSALLLLDGVLLTFGDIRHNKLGLAASDCMNQYQPKVVPRLLYFHSQMVSCGGCHTVVVAQPLSPMSDGENRRFYRLPWKQLDRDDHADSNNDDLTASYESFIAASQNSESWEPHKQKRTRLQMREKRRQRDEYIQRIESLNKDFLPSLQDASRTSMEMVMNEKLEDQRNNNNNDYLAPVDEFTEEHFVTTNYRSPSPEQSLNHTSHKLSHLERAESEEDVSELSESNEPPESESDKGSEIAKTSVEVDVKQPEKLPEIPNGKNSPPGMRDEHHSVDKKQPDPSFSSESSHSDDDEKNEQSSPREDKSKRTDEKLNPIPKKRTKSPPSYLPINNPVHHQNGIGEVRKPKGRRKARPPPVRVNEEESSDEVELKRPVLEDKPIPVKRTKPPQAPPKSRSRPSLKKTIPPPSPSSEEDEVNDDDEDDDIQEELDTPSPNEPKSVMNKSENVASSTEPVEAAKNGETVVSTAEKERIGCGRGNRTCIIS